MMRDVGERFYRLLHPRLAVVLVAGIEKPNPMALAWHTPVDDEERIIAVAVSKENYTYSLIEKYKEFTLNILRRTFLKDVWICGTVSGAEEDKNKLVSFTYEKGVRIKTPHIRESAGFLECAVENIIDFPSHALILAKVVYAAAEDRFFKYCWERGTELLMHVGGRVFCTEGEYLLVQK